VGFENIAITSTKRVLIRTAGTRRESAVLHLSLDSVKEVLGEQVIKSLGQGV